ncbi:hypothetical protein LP422_20500 [Janibacter limosus]|uniref:hypothetical protein n=1 Tax=Janibacter limosus TaxID=53458 RepID=UPI0035E2519C|nr:hypothetical protein LP422_20500 [Janibacter limosus]
MNPDRHPRRGTRPRATRGEVKLALAALFAVVVLLMTLATTTSPDASHVVSVGEQLPLQAAPYNGDVHEVVVPSATVTLRVGQPVEEIDSALVDLEDLPDADRAQGSDDPVRATDGAALVPVSWSVRPAPSGGSAEIRAVPITIRLVAGERSLDPADGPLMSLRPPEDETHPPMSIVGVERAADLSIEVEYGGATQTLDVATGELDTRFAAGLYSPTSTIDTGCGAGTSRCRPGTDPGSTRQVDRNDATITVRPLTIRPYDPELGWAATGQRWATVGVTLTSASGVKDGERYRSVDRAGPLEVTLDGAGPERSTGSGDDRFVGTRVGSAVFAVDADTPPRELSVDRDLTLEGKESPRTAPIHLSIPLDGGK